jgi:hypothetical protein
MRSDNVWKFSIISGNDRGNSIDIESFRRSEKTRPV